MSAKRVNGETWINVNGNYEDAYSRYKSSILTFEEQFAKPVLT